MILSCFFIFFLLSYMAKWRKVEKWKSGMSLVAVPCDSEKPQEKRKEGSMAEEKVGTGLFLLYLYFCLQCKKGRGQAIWKWRQVNFACVFVTFLFTEKVTGLLSLTSLPCRFLSTWSEKRQKKVKGKVKGETEDIFLFGKIRRDKNRRKQQR